jgi:hypothetical protein
MGAALLGLAGSLLVLTRPAGTPSASDSDRRPATDTTAGILPDLSSVDDAVPLANGWVIVDGRERTLHVTDSQGNVRRRIGRRGQGPGEFQYPRLVAVTATRLYAAQLGRPDLSEFDHEGRFIRLVRSSAPCGIGAPEMLAGSATELLVLRRCTEPPRRIRLQLERLIDGELRPWGWTDTIPMPPGGQIPFSIPVMALDTEAVLIGDGGSGCLRRIRLADGVPSPPSCLAWLPRLVTSDSLRQALREQSRGRLQVPDSQPRLYRLTVFRDQLAALVPDQQEHVRWVLVGDGKTSAPLASIGPSTRELSFLSHDTQLIVTDTDDGIRLEVRRAQR